MKIPTAQEIITEEMRNNFQKIALRCVEIYGTEAVQKFYRDWKMHEERLSANPVSDGE
jgi:ribosomal protein S3AE